MTLAGGDGRAAFHTQGAVRRRAGVEALYDR